MSLGSHLSWTVARTCTKPTTGVLPMPVLGFAGESRAGVILNTHTQPVEILSASGGVIGSSQVWTVEQQVPPSLRMDRSVDRLSL